jgi:hypothetical protein
LSMLVSTVKKLNVSTSVALMVNPPIQFYEVMRVVFCSL